MRRTDEQIGGFGTSVVGGENGWRSALDIWFWATIDKVYLYSGTFSRLPRTDGHVIESNCLYL